MTTATIYPIPGYPTVYLTSAGVQMTIRPMVPEDADALNVGSAPASRPCMWHDPCFRAAVDVEMTYDEGGEHARRR